MKNPIFFVPFNVRYEVMAVERYFEEKVEGVAKFAHNPCDQLPTVIQPPQRHIWRHIPSYAALIRDGCLIKFRTS